MAEFYQIGISSLMTVCVVDCLKIIDIKPDDSAIWPRAKVLLDQQAIHRTAILHLGQRVETRLLLQLQPQVMCDQP